MRRLLRRLLLSGAALVVVALVGFASYWYASLPSLKGALTVLGLSAPVEIVRDAEGVPHIHAQSAGDAYFALGFVHAQDRLWQMEMNRRVASGRLAEIVGPRAVNLDRLHRTLGIRRNAQAIYDAYDIDTRRALEMYAAGVNAGVREGAWALPIEFLLTGAPGPEPWTPADSIASSTMLAWDLGGNWRKELMRLRLSMSMSLEQIQELFPPEAGEQPLRTADYPKLYRALGVDQHKAVAALENDLPAAAAGAVDGLGSNGWVISGAHTESGKPLLANDPHLRLTVPSAWYFAHLSAPGLEVVGATLPGLPAVVVGRNDRIAWGFANFRSDVQDLYLERVNPKRPDQYQGPSSESEWLQFETRNERIRVKGKSDVVHTVRVSRHGPVISDALRAVGRVGLLKENAYVLALSWTALRADDHTVRAMLKLNNARHWTDFDEALRDFSAPQQTVLYADVDGHIGMVAPGRVPVRSPKNDLRGHVPAPGWQARYDWVGFVPFDSLPRVFDPPSGRIVVANQRILGEDYPHFMSTDWAPPYRSRRIEELLAASPKHTLESFRAIQLDTVSLAMRRALPLLLAEQPAGAQESAAVGLLKRWDGAMQAGIPEPLIASAWLQHLSRAVFAEKIGEETFSELGERDDLHQALLGILENRDRQSRWCADARSPGVTTCGRYVQAALTRALDDLSVRYGKDMSRWRWGEAHTVRAEHQPFGRSAVLSILFDLRADSPGDRFTVNVARSRVTDRRDPFVSEYGVSLRALYDLSDPGRSNYIYAGGQSGHRLSALYAGFWGRWRKGSDVVMQANRRRLAEEGAVVLALQPVPGGQP